MSNDDMRYMQPNDMGFMKIIILYAVDSLFFQLSLFRGLNLLVLDVYVSYLHKARV